MTIVEIAKSYLRYLQWFDEKIAKIQEEKKLKVKKLAANYQKLGLTEQEAFFRASVEVEFPSHPDQELAEEVCDIMKRGDLEGWELLRLIVENAPQEKRILCAIGAGPFEDWISTVNFNRFKKEIFQKLQTDNKWKTVIECCWHNPEELEQALNRK
jgi:hypothetical protein